MKLNQKNWNILLRFIILGLVAGSLAWELIEQIFSAAGQPFSLAAGPIGFSLHVLEISLLINPGSLIGLAGGWLLFSRA